MRNLMLGVALAALLTSSPAMACSPAPSCWMKEGPEYLRDMCDGAAISHLTEAQLSAFLEGPKQVPAFVKACEKLHVHIGRGPSTASASAGRIIPENWAPCGTGVQHGEPSFDEIPAWANTKALRPYYDSEPRLLANHGLCNAKFHRGVLCLPGWDVDGRGAVDETGAGKGPSFKVCQAWERLRAGRL